MDAIRIELEGDRIVLNFRREVGDIRKVRYLTGEEALALGLLMTADAPEQAIINFDVTVELSLQVINAPYQIVWLSVRDMRGDRTLVVNIEGKTIGRVGQYLLRLERIITGTKAEKVRPLVCPVSRCYLEDAEAE